MKNIVLLGQLISTRVLSGLGCVLEAQNHDFEHFGGQNMEINLKIRVWGPTNLKSKLLIQIWRGIGANKLKKGSEAKKSGHQKFRTAECSSSGS